jgi:hypothetical protein
VYDLSERRREIDTSFDFAKIRNMGIETIPEDVGKGGL